MTGAYWGFLVHGEQLQAPIPTTNRVQQFSRPSRGGSKLADPFSVARVRPRTSKGITDLLLLYLVRLTAASPSKKSILCTNEGRTGAETPARWSPRTKDLVSRTESRSLSELTRQITPPTKNGHAPPPTKSRKSYQSVNPSGVRAWWDFPCWVKLSHRLHPWWCPSVNYFKFQLCNHTSPGTHKLWFPGSSQPGR